MASWDRFRVWAGSTLRVLVFRGGALGDLLLTLPALVALRQACPHAKVHLFGAMPQARLAQPFPAEMAFDLNGRDLTGLFGVGGSPAQPWMDAVRGADLALSYLSDPEGVVASNLNRLGVRQVIVGPSRPNEFGRHAAEQLAMPVRAVFGNFRLGWPTLPLVAERGTPRHAIALHLGSGSKSKNWPVGHWVNLARRLRKAAPERRLALVCGEADGTATDEFLARLPEAQAECWRGLPLLELACRLSRCDALLGHDSGISHLAAAAGTPVFAFFGPTNPEVWAPHGPTVKVMPAPTQCLADLEPEAVWPELWPWLEQRRVNRNARRMDS
jgi:heptosyltransferase-3